MPNIGPVELIIILVVALLVIGPGKLPDVGSALGKSIREFRKAATDVQDSVKLEPPVAPVAPPAAVAPVAPIAAPAPPPAAVAPVAPIAAPAPPPAAVAPVAAPAPPPAAVAPVAAPAPPPAAPAPAPTSVAAEEPTETRV